LAAKLSPTKGRTKFDKEGQLWRPNRSSGHKMAANTGPGPIVS